MSARHHRHIVLLLAIIGFTLFGPVSSGAAQTATIQPRITSTTAILNGVGSISVVGDGFTPDGSVYVAVIDRAGEARFVPDGSANPALGHAPSQSRWIHASGAVYGPNGSIDPASGYVQGGFISESFDVSCDSDVLVRVFDVVTGSWSNWIDAGSACQRQVSPPNEQFPTGIDD